MTAKKFRSSLLVTQRAIRDLAEIETHSISQWGEGTAASYLADIEAALVRIQKSPQLELVAPTPFSLVSFRHVDGDEATDAIAARINTSGHSYVTPSVIDGRRFIRVSIGGANTTAVEVDRLWEVVSG